MILFDEQSLDDYGAKIGLSSGWLLSYLDSFSDFNKYNLPEINNFFSGNTDRLNSYNVDVLKKLIEDSDLISNGVASNNFVFSTFLDWEITDYLDDLKNELLRVVKTPKFFRSSKNNFYFSSTLEIPAVLAQNQTLEDVAFNVQNNPNYDDDWINIAQRNDLFELDYDLSGGSNLILGFNISSRNYSIKSVVDVIIGERILGKDIQRKLRFEDDDLLVLGYKETAYQSVEILSNLQKGDIPEFKQFGRSLFIGTSTNAVGLSTIVRELYTVFSSDDSLINFKVRDYSQKGVDTVLLFDVSTRLAETIKSSVNSIRR